MDLPWYFFLPPFTYALRSPFRVINYPALKMITEGTPRKSKQSFKHEITLIAQCVNIEIQYMAGWGKNTLINDVWCGFTNYIFQAFKRETRLIAEESFLNAGKSADFCFLITIAAPLINYVNWMEAFSHWMLIENSLAGRKYIISLFPFFLPPITSCLRFHFHISMKIKSGEKFRKLLVVWG